VIRCKRSIFSHHQRRGDHEIGCAPIAGDGEVPLELLLELASPHIAVRDLGDTRGELLTAVNNAVRALRETSFGPVIRALLSQIAINPALGDPFRTTIVKARREEVPA
jgi:hypothetical protein